MEKRFQIDIHCLRESYDAGELTILGWIRGTTNLADAMIKNFIKDVYPLKELMRENQKAFSPLGWAKVSLGKKSSKVNWYFDDNAS